MQRYSHHNIWDHQPLFLKMALMIMVMVIVVMMTMVMMMMMMVIYHQVCASKVYTSAEFKREKDNFQSLCKNLERTETKRFV